MNLDYVCNACHGYFEQPATIYYREYAGASAQEEYVSPCCHSRYEERFVCEEGGCQKPCPNCEGELEEVQS